MSFGIGPKELSLSAHRFHHLWITFRVFLSGESVQLETCGKN